MSKKAIEQNPQIIGWPFTGQTVPKKRKNKPYPQRVPDPVVSLTVVNNNGVVVEHPTHSLNMVYYSNKSEIRITVPTDVLRATPEYSIMVMSLSESGLDYEIDIHAPNAPTYERYLGICNQTLPSGGSLRARRFGWL
jgi:hypothetical protein